MQKCWGVLLTLSLCIAGCGTTGSKRWSRGYKKGLDKSARAYLQNRIHGEIPEYDMPIEINDRVIEQIDLLLRGESRLKRQLARSGRYETWMKKILKEEGVPQDLFYLALIESGFSNHALSRARALGPWQFIRSTGRIFGLKSNGWVDERKDPEKATRAAARYLKKLYNEFGDWYLAMAGYNAGEGKVRRAIRQGKSRSFWILSADHTHYFKRETKNYVPRVIAAALIAKMPSRFGLGEIEYDVPFEYKVVRVKDSIDLNTAAKWVNADPAHFHYLNPELKQLITPPGTYHLKVPVETAKTFEEVYASLPPKERRLKVVKHRVRRGDTLWNIARKYRVSTRSLMRTNGLSGSRARRLRVGKVLTIPIRGANNLQYASATSTKAIYYRVQRGDNLSRIARRHGVSLSGLRRDNHIKGNYLRVGQRLKIRKRVHTRQPVLLAYKPPKQNKKRLDGVEWLIREDGKKGKPIRNEEKGGEVQNILRELASKKTIVDRQGVQLAQKPTLEEKDLEGEGNFTTTPPAKPDRRVVLRPKGKASPKRYRVRRGDNLWRIARKHRVTVSDLKHWNGLQGNQIRPGIKLVLTADLAESARRVVEKTGQRSKSTKHRVRRGESLWGISRQYGVTVAQLKVWNDLTSHRIRFGKTLRVAARPEVTRPKTKPVLKPDSVADEPVMSAKPSASGMAGQATAFPPIEEEFEEF